MTQFEDAALPGEKSGELFQNLLLFARGLKGKGFRITPGRIIDAARSLSFIDLSIRADFAGILRTNLASSPAEIRLFNEFFQEFWKGLEKKPRRRALPSGQGTEAEEGGEENLPLLLEEQYSPEEPGAAGEEGQGLRYSAGERLAVKDFSRISWEEAPLLTKEIRRLLSVWVMKTSRRKKPAARGRAVDFRRSFRKIVRHGGEILELVRKDSKVKPLKVIILCDVSGSMEAATRFSLQFFHEMQRAFPRNETFVFSTRLTRITGLLKRTGWPGALKKIGERAQDWSGGTRIGECLRVFNERYARSLAAGSMVVIFISDGWDRGDAALLEAEMKRLKRRARRIVWMNPLLETPGYQPICRGMKAALPHIDDFLPASRLRSFKRLEEVLLPPLKIIV